MTLQSGTRFGPYEILSPIGAGGMGEVYRARDTKLGRDVAIKALPPAFAGDPERVGRFQREAQLLAALNHPHIAAIYGLEDSGDTRLLAMELVEGESLADRLRAGALPVDEAIAIARQIGDALAAAHDKGIIHRDLKPGNVMLTADGQVKVLDFGLAKMLETEPALSGVSMSPTLSVQATLAGTILGTAAYMSPEQARGRPVDKRADIWAFGCVLYETLTAARAFPGDDVTDTIAAVVRGEPDWKALPADVPRHIRSLIERCLAKDPRQRFADISVPLFLLNEPREQAVAVPAPSARAAGWKRLLPLGAAVVVTSAMTGGAVWTMRPALNPPAVARFTVPLLDDQRFTNAGRHVLTLSPDGSKLVYVANLLLFLRGIGDLEAHEIPGSNVDGSIINPVFSPDGTEVAFFAGSDATLKRLAVAGGAAVTITPATAPLGMSWSADGILFGQPQGILRVSPTGGVPEVVIPGKDESLASPQMLPDGKGVLFTVKAATDAWEKARVVVQSPDGARTTLVDGGSDGRYLPSGHLVYAAAGILLAVPFDLDRLAVTGGPVPVIEGVRRAGSATQTGGTPAAQVSVAANGSVAYVPGPVKLTEEGTTDLALFDDKGGLARLGLRLGTYRAPRVSQDGRAVAFSSDSTDSANVFVYDLNGGRAARQLTFGGANRAPIWSPDGLWIAFQSDREGDAAIFRQRADGSGTAERLSKPEKGVTHTPQSWSPDGAHLLFSVNRDQRFTLSVLNMKDGEAGAFSKVSSAVSPEAVFSPDGRWVAYQAREQSGGGALQSFVEPFPATGAKYLVPQDGGQPFWSRTGDRLHLNVTATRSVVVAVATTPGVSFGVPKDFPRIGRQEQNPNNNRRGADAMPDGRLLGVTIVSEDGDQAFDRIVIVLNWFEELKQRVPTR